MGVADIFVPQLGEGLQEVFIRELLKQPGEPVKRDEPIYVMETDKALIDAESPLDGVFQEWLAQVNVAVPVGSLVARILTPGAKGTPPADPRQELAKPADVLIEDKSVAKEPFGNFGGVLVPPRTRAYCRSLGIGAEEMKQIPASDGKLMPSHVERYLAKKDQTIPLERRPAYPTSPGDAFTDRKLSLQQSTLLFRLKRSSQVVVPGNIARPVEWRRIIDIVNMMAQCEQGKVRASEFQILAYCVAQASRSHPKFRSNLINQTTVREYSHLNLGLAMARPDDDLITAVVAEADELGLANFINRLQRQMRQAWKDGDQAGPTTQLVLSYLGSYGVTEGVPTLVAPASAVLFIGASYMFQETLQAKVSITFDHRLINGVGAARFINTIDSEIDQLHEQATQLAKENI